MKPDICIWKWHENGWKVWAFSFISKGASLVAQLVKNPPAMLGTWVWSLGWEDPLERKRIPTPVFWRGELHGLHSPWGHKELDMTERLSLTPGRYAWSLTKFGLIDWIPKHASISAEMERVFLYPPSGAGVPDGLWFLITLGTSNGGCFWRQFTGEDSC